MYAADYDGMPSDEPFLTLLNPVIDSFNSPFREIGVPAPPPGFLADHYSLLTSRFRVSFVTEDTVYSQVFSFRTVNIHFNNISAADDGEIDDGPIRGHGLLPRPMAIRHHHHHRSPWSIDHRDIYDCRFLFGCMTSSCSQHHSPSIPIPPPW